MIQVPVTTTPEGQKTLGRFLRDLRLRMGWTMQDVTDAIRAKGYTLTTSVISDLEAGKRQPQWNTLCKVCQAGYVQDPLTGRAFTVSDLFLIACEVIDPFSSWVFKPEASDTNSPTLLTLSNAYTFACLETVGGI